MDGKSGSAILTNVQSNSSGLTVRADQLARDSQELEAQFHQTQALLFLDEAILKAEQAVEIAPPPHRLPYYHNLGRLVSIRYERTCDIQHYEQIFPVAQQCGMEVAAMLNNISHRLLETYQRTGQEKYLNESIRTGEKSIDETLPSSPMWGTRSANLGNAYGALFKKTGDLRISEEALKKHKIAVHASKGTPEHARCLVNLGAVFAARLDRTGAKEDLTGALEATQAAVLASEPAAPGQMLSNLSSLLASRFEHLGDIRDLNDAISRAEQAVSVLGAQSEDCAGALSTLANRLERKYEWTGNSDFLEEAVSHAMQALKLTQLHHIDRPSLLSQLASKMQRWSERAGNTEHIDQAIRLQQEAVQTTTEENQHRSSWLMNLSNMLLSRYEANGEADEKDLRDSIDQARTALESSEEDHPRVPDLLSNLASILAIRYRCSRKSEDFQEALNNSEISITLTSEEDPKTATRLCNLASLLNLSLEASHKTQALEAYMSAWQCAHGSPFVRVSAAIQALDLLLARQSWTQAYSLAREAVNFMPIVSNRSLSFSDQQHAVGRFARLASNACALALQLDDNAHAAVELLEQGRGLIISLLIDARSEISDLKRTYPEHLTPYEDYERVLFQLNKKPTEIEGFDERRALQKSRQELHRQLNICIEKIRRLPGQARFLLSPRHEELMTCLEGSCIVIVNVTDFRSDALLFSASEALSINLPDLTATKCKSWFQQDLTRGRVSNKERSANNKAFRGVLANLWSACVKVVLERIAELSTIKVTADGLPHIYWIGVGLASFLPFHAAGSQHSARSSENILSHAVSSYTPTIKALKYSRQRVSELMSFPACELEVLTVGMPTTPRQDDLVHAEPEIKAIKDIARDFLIARRLQPPSAANALEQMQTCDMVHFACHGVVNTKNPSKSHLILQRRQTSDPSSTLLPDPLTVEQISEISLKRARIAYLSACSTAQNRSESLADEVLHLASGFQAAGFASVVGCMWPAKDDVCVAVAKAFYEQLGMLLQTARAEERNIVALALHRATLQVRANAERQPLAWAPYAHFGA